MVVKSDRRNITNPAGHAAFKADSFWYIQRKKIRFLAQGGYKSTHLPEEPKNYDLANIRLAVPPPKVELVIKALAIFLLWQGSH